MLRSSVTPAPRSQLTVFLLLVPQDAAKPNVVPSGEGVSSKKVTSEGLGSSSIDQPAATGSGLGEVISASGGELPENVGEKYSWAGGKERDADKKSTPHGGRNQPSH